jgi:hypothetical protein
VATAGEDGLMKPVRDDPFTAPLAFMEAWKKALESAREPTEASQYDPSLCGPEN